MFAKGIIDPTKVVRSALQDASIAGLLITTEAMIADKPEEKDASPAMPPMAAAWVNGRHGRHGNVKPFHIKNLRTPDFSGFFFFQI